MRKARLIGSLSVVVLLAGALAAAPPLLDRVQVETDPVEILQRRIDVLEMQLRELSVRLNAGEVSEPLAAGAADVLQPHLAGK